VCGSRQSIEREFPHLRRSKSFLLLIQSTGRFQGSVNNRSKDGSFRVEILERLKPLALLLLRVGIGIVFIFHGYPKLFTHTHDMMPAFQRMGFPPYFVYIAGVIEFFGGIVLILGLFTRIGALLLAGEMAIAILKVHLPQGPITEVKNYEFPMVLAVACFALATIGAGLISLDHAIYSGGGRPPRRLKDRG
jgi:putative oxidoreductase